MDSERVTRLEELLAEYDAVGVGRQVGFERLHLYSIITHSTAIEGSTLTLEENTVMFDDGVAPVGKQVHEQMMNLDLRRAYEVAGQIAASRTRITLPLLKALSALVMRNTGSYYRTLSGDYDESKGDLRLQNVSAGRGGKSYLAWQKVPGRTSEFVAWLDDKLAVIDAMTAAEVYELSFEAHYRLVTIHPWSDGNGRMARLLMNLVQLEGGVVPFYVRSQNKSAYIAALQSAQDEGTPIPFVEFMTDETAEILAAEIAEYKDDLEGDVPWAHEGEGRLKPGTPQVTPQVIPKVRELLLQLGAEAASAAELMRALGLSDRKNFRELYLRPAIAAGYIEMTIPDKPQSSKQRYRLTRLGSTAVATLEPRAEHPAARRTAG